MKKDEHTDSDFNMRRNFAEQTIRFWKNSKQEHQYDSSPQEESPGNAQPQDNQTEQPASSRRARS